MTRSDEEEKHCMAFAEWCGLQSNTIPELKLMYHVPNGGVRPHMTRVGPDGRTVRYSVEGQKLRKMGAKKGVWDYHLPVGRGWLGAWKNGLWLEFKSKDGELSPEQIAWGAAMEQQHHVTYVVRDWEEAKKITCAYLGLPEGMEIGTRKQ